MTPSMDKIRVKHGLAFRGICNLKGKTNEKLKDL